MNTQQRQRQRQADNSRQVPQGAGAPNWLVVVVAGAITAAALVARAFI